MKTFASSLKDLRTLLDAIAPLEKPLAKAADILADSLIAGGKVLACGNGGSAADSAHFATELTCRFQEDRKPYPAIALAADAGLLTAIGNDYDFRDVFSRQVDAFGRPGDVLVAITTSGKSRNVLDGLEMARRREMHTILLTGKGGGFCKGAADVEICVPQTTCTARIQEVQAFLLHVLCEELETRLPLE